MASGAALEKFPRPAVAVDLAIFAVTDVTGPAPELRVVVQQRQDPGGLVLPGGFMRERATIQATVADVLRRKLEISLDRELAPRLLRVFDDPARDDRTWAISIAHSVSMRADELITVRGDLVQVTVDGRLALSDPLLFDHSEIVSAAVEALRNRYEIRYRPEDARPDPDGFLPEPFTLHQLRMVHEAILGEALHKDNFNYRMKPYLKAVVRDGHPVRAENLRGRPATLYRRRTRLTEL